MVSVRKTRTSSGAVAVQVVEYVDRRVKILKHVGSAHSDTDVKGLQEAAYRWIERESGQVPLFKTTSEPESGNGFSEIGFLGARHGFIRDVFIAAAQQIGFNVTTDLWWLDLAFMRLIEPASKSRTVELITKFWGINYSRVTIQRNLGTLVERKPEIETIAAVCAEKLSSSGLGLVLYDMTTLYFESFKADELRVPGFSKDGKPQQPQLVVGLLVSSDGFPLTVEIFPGNTYEGSTMITVVNQFIKRHEIKEKPVVVADAGMLSKSNTDDLEAREPGRRAKYVQKTGDNSYKINQKLVDKTEKLLGVRGYWTNISSKEMSSNKIIGYYQDLWKVEQAFRVSKHDIAARPIYHHKDSSIQAHMIICFTALILAKYLEIRTGKSIRYIKDQLLTIQDAQLVNTTTGETQTLRTKPNQTVENLLNQLEMSY